jgi:hypothetical protein
MKIKLISYANKDFYKSQQLLKKSALKYGVDEVMDYNDMWLKRQTIFYEKNKSILKQERGNGCWLWKPYILLDGLKNLEANDVLLYIDAGASIINNIKPLINILTKKEIILFYNNGHKNKTWTKRDCFYYMDCDNKQYHDAEQLLAGYIVCKKTPFVISLLEEWLRFAEDERIITDISNECGLPNLDGFVDHRHDQSILSILATKYNIELFRDPSQWGNKYKMPAFRIDGEFHEDGYVLDRFQNSTYPTIIDGHRTKMPFTFMDSLKYFFLSIKN